MAAMAARMSALAPRVAARRAAGRASALVVRASSGGDYMRSLPGAVAPLGFWDPLGFSSSPTFTVSEAKRFREAEVTHGRVSMLAVLGWLVAEEYHPLFGGEIGGPAFRHFQVRRLHRSRPRTPPCSARAAAQSSRLARRGCTAVSPSGGAKRCGRAASALSARRLRARVRCHGR
jgi:hypothetical protein